MDPAFGLLKSARNWALVATVTLTVLFVWHVVARATLSTGETSNG